MQNTKNLNEDLLGTALVDYVNNNYTEDLKTYSSLDEEAVMPLPYLFRTFEEMPMLEQKALELSKGSILDIGCGAGSHSLWLQNNNHKVTALDTSPGAIAVCKKRGIAHCVESEFLTLATGTYDTLLLLMNGIGIAGKLKHLPDYLTHFKKLLKPGGKVLLDSSDIIYMFDQDEDGGYWTPGNVDYYGEVSFTFSYKNQIGPKFDWLYLDFNTLAYYAETHGFTCELLAEGEHYDYLAKLTVS